MFRNPKMSWLSKIMIKMIIRMLTSVMLTMARSWKMSCSEVGRKRRMRTILITRTPRLSSISHLSPVQVLFSQLFLQQYNRYNYNT